MKDPNNKTISLYAIACVTVIAITAMLLTTVANAQDWRSQTILGDFGDPDVTVSSVQSTKQDCQLLNNKVMMFVNDNGGINVGFTGGCFFTGDGEALFTFEIDGEYVTMATNVIEHNSNLFIDSSENKLLLLLDYLSKSSRFKVELEYDNQYADDNYAIFSGSGSARALAPWLANVGAQGKIDEMKRMQAQY